LRVIRPIERLPLEKNGGVKGTGGGRQGGIFLPPSIEIKSNQVVHSTGNSGCTRTYTCAKPIPVLMGMGIDGCGYGYP